MIDRLYVHVPFCSSKCDYCAFHSIPVSDSDYLIQQYFAKLERDIKESKHLTSPLKSIFIGGGSPSYLKTNNIEKLFSIIANNFTIAENAEISVENNPESLTLKKIKTISSFANRISVGVQSFNKSHLDIIGRSRDENISLEKIVSAFLKNNIDNISIDLIYGIPTQTVKDWENELMTALDLPIKHLSAYSLTYEEGTKLYTNVNPNLEDLSCEMWKLTSEILYPKMNRYEISNYSQPGLECKHNFNIWFGEKYLGLGPAASSFDGKTRWTQQNLDHWLNGTPPEIDNLPYHKRLVEIFIMGLRTTIGWTVEINGKNVFMNSPYSSPLELSKQDWISLEEKLITLNQAELITTEKNNHKTRISSTQKGLLFWNELATELL